MSAVPPTDDVARTVVDMRELSPYADARSLVGVETGERSLELRWSDGLRAEFHYIWLRDHCPCDESRHPRTRERLVRVIDLPEELPAPAASITDAGALELQWPAMGDHGPHTSRFDPGWLRQRAGSPEVPWAGNAGTVFWDGQLAGRVPTVTHDDYMNRDQGIVAWARALHSHGLVLLRDGPTSEGEILRVAARVGWPRETNFGRHFDVVSRPDPNNAAFTAIALEPHVDLPNWQRPPDYQLLYCLANEAEGGASVFTDGFAVAAALRAEDPDAFHILADTPIDFRFQDEDTDVAARKPVIGLDAGGHLAEIRFNNWIRDTLRLPPDQVEAYYRAYRRFWRMLREPRFAIRFTLRAGEMIAFDNLRVLHGRDAFDPDTGHRHLQGCYIDRDLVQSRLRVLERSGG